MKKLLALMSLLLVTSTSFSQTVTNQTTKVQTDTIVAVSIPTAKLIIKDLIKGDGAILQLDETNKVLKLTNEKLVLKDSIIGILNSKVANLDYIINQKDEQFGLERQKSESLLKELKAEKRKSFLYKIGSYVGIVATGILLVK